MRTLITMLLLVLLTVSGCAKPKPPSAVESLEQRVQEASQQRDRAMDASRPSLVVSNGVYLGSAKPLPLPDSGLPGVFQSDVTLVEPRGLYLHEIVQRLTQLTGIAIRVAPQPRRETTASEGTSDNAAVSAAEEAGNSPMTLRYNGSLKGLLDSVCATYGMYWEYIQEEGCVQIFYLKTQTFSLAASPGKTVNVSKVSNKGTASASGDGESMTLGEQSTELSVELDVWAQTVSSVSAMLSKDGQVVANQAIGTITVSDVPAVLARVQAYIDATNRRLSRQVSLVIRVYSVEVSDESNHQFNLGAVVSDIKGLTVKSLGGTLLSESTSGLGSLTALIEPGDTKLGKHFSGSQAVLTALNRWGKTALVTSASGVTLHNQALPIQVVQRTSYLASASQTTVADSGTTNSLTPGQLTTGFSLSATPNILDSRRVVLNYTLSLSQLDSLQEIVVGGTDNEQRIQLPQVSTRSFQQRVSMPIGSTLVLGGFEQHDGSAEDGIGVLAVGKQVQEKKRTIVICIDLNDVEIF